jgi:SHS2 domain-containing protein
MSEAPQQPVPAPNRAAPGHRFVDHPSEAHLLVYGGSMADVAGEAGRALASLTLGEPLPEATGPWREIEVCSPDAVALLVDWLNELICLAESEQWMPLEFDVIEATQTYLHARLRGRALGTSPSLVKAATHHGARLEEMDGVLEAHLLLDV